MRYLKASLPALAITALVACQPADRSMDRDEDRAMGTTAEMSPDDRARPAVNVEAHRGAVEESVRETRERLESLREPMAERSQEAWQEISERASDTWADVRASLDESRDAGADDLRRSRSDLAGQLAELDSEIAAEEVKMADTPAEVRQVVEEWLDRLAQNVTAMNASATNAMEDQPDRDDLEDLRERMAEVRQELREMTADPDAFEDRRDDVASELAEVTVQVREYHYLTEWSNRAVAAR